MFPIVVLMAKPTRPVSPLLLLPRQYIQRPHGTIKKQILDLTRERIIYIISYFLQACTTCQSQFPKKKKIINLLQIFLSNKQKFTCEIFFFISEQTIIWKNYLIRIHTYFSIYRKYQSAFSELGLNFNLGFALRLQIPGETKPTRQRHIA